MSDQPMPQSGLSGERSPEATFAESIIDTMRDPLLVLNRDLHVVLASREFYRTFGVTREETEGRVVYELGNRQWNIPRLRTLLEEILPTETTFRDFEVEHVFETIGRKVMLLNARMLDQGPGDDEKILLVIEDATARRDAEDARRDAETRFTEMVKNVRDHSIFLTDPDGVITSWNVAAERVMGFTETEAVGKHFSLIFTPEDVEDGVPEWELRTAREEGRAEDERWHVKKVGERFWALGIVTPLRDVKGRLTGFSKILRDMTDRKRTEEELWDADRRKDDFLALLAHELRNPLAPIRNGLQVIRLSEDRAVRERSQAVMDRQLAHMVRLIDDLLDVSRINRSKMELRRSRILLADALGSAVETARPLIQAAGHELTTALPADPIALDADLTRLAQVFSNLLTNSAKYTKPGGKIRLTARLDGTEVVVTVSDTGIGIPSASLPTIFDMFSQVDRSVERATGGLGIGLALVKGLVEMHGGTVTAVSGGQDQGSVFTVRLPAIPARPSTTPTAGGPTDAVAGRKRRILVVDDNRDSARSMGEMLRLSGNEVALAYDGLDAVERAEAFRPEAILMDVGMPRLNGLDATRRIRQQPWGREVTIIALTGWGQEGDRTRSKDAGCDGHLVKPVSLPDLERMLHELSVPT